MNDSLPIAASAGYASTAPTSPDGSLTFSPRLGPRRTLDNMADGFEIDSRYHSRSSASSSGELAPRAPIRNICCVGAGYVGGPTAAVIAFQNPHIRVTVVDKDVNRIRRWNSRHPPIYEPGLGDIVRVARDGSREISFSNRPTAKPADSLDGEVLDDSTSSSEYSSQCGDGSRITNVAARTPNLIFSTDVSGCISEADVVLIAVNTPTKSRGAGKGYATDMTAFEAVTREVARHAKDGAMIVEKSTVPCRTAELVKKTLALHRPGVHFEILSNPEFLAAGTAMTDLLRPDRVLIGSSITPSGRRAAEAFTDVYAAWVPRHRIISTNVYSSELAKLVANSMLAQRISSINSIAAICEKTGADIDEVTGAIGRDMRIGDKFLKAGIGFGGSCFKKDLLSLVYLAQSVDLDETAEYWQQVIAMNEWSRDRFARRVVKALNNTLVGKKVVVLGYAFKKNTSDTRETPALGIIRTILDEGPKEVAVFDPCCNPAVTKEEMRRGLKDMDVAGGNILREDGGPLAVYDDAYAACEAADAILITADFDEFKNTPVHIHTKTESGPSAPAPAPVSASASAPAPVSAPTSNGNLARPNKRVGPVDPRPFERLEPTESDLLALQTFLIKSAADATKADDPLARYHPEPTCDEACPDCVHEKSGYNPNEEYKPKERLDWAKISYHMNMPRLVFDGRNVVDVREMKKLGFEVESIGRQAL